MYGQVSIFILHRSESLSFQNVCVWEGGGHARVHLEGGLLYGQA